MASLLGNLVSAGLTTLLTTQAALGSVGSAPNLYTINHGQLVAPDAVLFTPGVLAQNLSGTGGLGNVTLTPLCVTLNGVNSIWYNPNTTVVTGQLICQYFHSSIR